MKQIKNIQEHIRLKSLRDNRVAEIWGQHTGEIEGQPFDGVYPERKPNGLRTLLKYKIRNPGLWPCHLNDCNSRKILILSWNGKAWLRSQAFNMGNVRSI